MFKKCCLGLFFSLSVSLSAWGADFSDLVSDVANKKMSCAFVLLISGKQYKYEPGSIGFSLYQVKAGSKDVLLLSVWDDSEIWAYHEETTESELTPILEDLKNHECPQEINYGDGKLTFANSRVL